MNRNRSQDGHVRRSQRVGLLARVSVEYPVSCEMTFQPACRSARDDRDEARFHFQNDLPVRFNFQMFTSCIGAFREVSTISLRVLPCPLSHNFHFSASFPAMVRPRAFQASDFAPKTNEHITAEMRMGHDLSSF
jgi:hypothetical protein